MRTILQPIRFVTVLVALAFYLLQMPLQWVLIPGGRWRKLKFANHVLPVYCRFGLWLLNVHVNTPGIEKVVDLRPALFVGNHLSYLDVLVFSAQVPACFVTSMEIKKTPVLGQLCRAAGCLFVERRNRNNIHNEISEITEGFEHRLNVNVFPEATSTNGEQILRFRKGLYVAAIQSSTPIAPFCLNYLKVSQQPITIHNRDKVFWYGEMSFVPHLWQLCGAGRVDVDLVFLDPIATSPGDDAIALAQRSQTAVESVFRAVRPESADQVQPGQSEKTNEGLV